MGFRHFWRRGAAPLRLQRVRLGDCHRTKPFPLLTNPEWRVSNSRRDLPAKSNIAGAPSKRKARPRRSNAEWRTPPGFVTQPRRERNITKRAKSVTVWAIQPDPPEERRLQAVARKHLPPAKWSRRRPTTKPAAPDDGAAGFYREPFRAPRRLRDDRPSPRHSNPASSPVHHPPHGVRPLNPSRSNEDTSRHCRRSKGP